MDEFLEMFMVCHPIQSADLTVDCMVWYDAPRNGENRTQKEPKLEEGIPFADMVERFIAHSVVCLKHIVEDRWTKRSLLSNVMEFAPSEMVVLTDFSATPDLQSRIRVTAMEAEHAVLDVFVVVHSP